MQNTKTNCLNRINILKTLAYHQWRVEEKVLLRIYRTLIRSRLDYGSILYISASDTDLKSLNTIHNTSLRFSLGAFKSSPSESLYIESSEPPLFIRGQRLLLSYFSRISANPKNPVIKLIKTPHPVSDNSHPRVHSLSQILRTLLKDTDLKLTTPFTTSRILPWTKKLPTVLTSLNPYKKEETPRTLLVQAFGELIQTQRYEKILYTDALKEEQVVGCVISTSNTTVVSYQLSPRCSIHTAELYGILKALDSPIANEKSLAICTNSLSAIDSIRNIYSINPIVQCIHSICQQQSKNGVSVTIIWIPSHVGIIGNENADHAAKLACSLENMENIQLHQDLKSSIKNNVLSTWQTYWNVQNTKLRTIQLTVTSITMPQMSRKDNNIIRRLRIGHTRLTHGYLMSSENHPRCEHCNESLTVQHILLECVHYKP
ncbi:uncharacterized protein [Diabrotica undecimpunctata]|uniref:uncharacterized protein n=1 Tax=Diabrotica undecimpunctata TaxID=50387 RepID=UPI003B637C73